MDSGNFCSFGVIPTNPSMEDNAILSLVSNSWVGSRGAGSTDGIESMQLKSEEVLLSPGGKTIKISKLDFVLPCSCSFSVKDYKWHQLVSRLKTTVQTAGQCFKVFWDRLQSKRVANERAVKIIKLRFTISWLIVEILSLHQHHWHSLCSVAYHWTFPRVTISSSDLTKVKHSIDNVTQKNFQLNVKCDSVLLWFCFTPLCHCSRTSQDSLKQSDSKLVATRLPAFSRTSGGFLDFTLSSHWPHGIFSFSLIGYFCFWFYNT